MEILVNGEIVLYGAVGESYWSDSFTDRDVILALNELRANDKIIVRMNSGGGDAFMGLTIFNALKACPSEIVIYVDGIAASAASVIAMAADRLIMNEGSMMMIHDPASVTYGDAADHEKTQDLLNKLGDQMARLYSRRANGEPDEIRDMMRAETWLTSDEAVSLGFADEADSEAEAKVAALFDYRIYANAPKALVAMATANASLFKSENKTSRDETERNGIMPKNIEVQANEPAAQTGAENDPAEAEPIDNGALIAAARQEERARITAITTDEQAAGRSDLAAHFAFNTSMSVADAVAALKASPVKAKGDAARTPAQGHNVTTQIVEPLETMDGGTFSASKPQLNATRIYDAYNGVK